MTVLLAVDTSVLDANTANNIAKGMSLGQRSIDKAKLAEVALDELLSQTTSPVRQHVSDSVNLSQQRLTTSITNGSNLAQATKTSSDILLSHSQVNSSYAVSDQPETLARSSLLSQRMAAFGRIQSPGSSPSSSSKPNDGANDSIRRISLISSSSGIVNRVDGVDVRAIDLESGPSSPTSTILSRSVMHSPSTTIHRNLLHESELQANRSHLQQLNRSISPTLLDSHRKVSHGLNEQQQPMFESANTAARSGISISTQTESSWISHSNAPLYSISIDPQLGTPSLVPVYLPNTSHEHEARSVQQGHAGHETGPNDHRSVHSNSESSSNNWQNQVKSQSSRDIAENQGVDAPNFGVKRLSFDDVRDNIRFEKPSSDIRQSTIPINSYNSSPTRTAPTSSASSASTSSLPVTSKLKPSDLHFDQLSPNPAAKHSLRAANGTHSQTNSIPQNQDHMMYKTNRLTYGSTSKSKSPMLSSNYFDRSQYTESRGMYGNRDSRNSKWKTILEDDWFRSNEYPRGFNLWHEDDFISNYYNNQPAENASHRMWFNHLSGVSEPTAQQSTSSTSASGSWLRPRGSSAFARLSNSGTRFESETKPFVPNYSPKYSPNDAVYSVYHRPAWVAATNNSVNMNTGLTSHYFQQRLHRRDMQSPIV